MVPILMMSEKLATLGLLKTVKAMTSSFLFMTSPKRFYHVTQIIL